ncbi:hypothetical protein EJD97_016100 [Solanum chilense]|uniref:Uncharacterized protein n=1 Tax=Solanum chilense TaxID=4083 RepID=A0A6N2BAB9_SOLCI|nr:hypothetical protein EJD97_016100 [Solanum chilense]
MKKSSSSKKNSSKNKYASTSKDPKKRGRKAAPPIVRTTLQTPTPEEISSLGLPDINYLPPNQSVSSISDNDDVHSEEVSDFEDFTTKPSFILLKRTSRGVNVGTTPPKCKRIKSAHQHKYDLSRLSKAQKEPDQQPDHSFQNPEPQQKESDNIAGVGVSPNSFNENKLGQFRN